MITPSSPPERARRRGSRRDGFALPMAILVIALVTIGLVASFSATRSEIGNLSAQRSQARAYSIAQAGLEYFLARRGDTTCNGGNKAYASTEKRCCPHCWAVNSAGGTFNGVLPTVRETLAVKYAGFPGYAIVKVSPVRLDLVAGAGTYLITSTGYDTTGAIYSGTKVRYGTRTVGLFATYSKVSMKVSGAWVSLSGMVKNGTGEIDGNDHCGSGTNVPGVTVPLKPDGTANLQVSGSFVPTGNPPYDTTQTVAQLASTVKIDWAAIRAGAAFPADLVIPGNAFPTVSQFAADTNFWPVIHVYNGRTGTNTGWTLPNQGRGTLIVDGDLTISGSNQWYGIILVGGQLVSNGNNVSEGTTMSGLNILTGDTVAAGIADATANGQKSYVFNSCSVAQATSRMASKYYTISNSWMDNLAGY